MIWSGVWKDYDSAAEGAVVNHTSDRWISRSISRLRTAQGEDYNRPASLFSSNPLLIIPSLLDLTTRGITPKVIDYGGNLGQLYFWLCKWFPHLEIEWTVVEREDFLGNPVISDNLPPQISTVSTLNDCPPGANILHFGSSMQYIPSLEEELSAFLEAVSPIYVSVADFMGATNIDDFFTRQNYDGGHLISCFRNVDSVVEFFGQFGFELAYRSGSLNEVTIDYYPEADLPEQNRIRFPWDMIFASTKHIHE